MAHENERGLGRMQTTSTLGTDAIRNELYEIVFQKKKKNEKWMQEKELGKTAVVGP